MSVQREVLWTIARELGFASMGVTTPDHALPLPVMPPRALPFEPRSVIALSYPTFRWADRSDGDGDDTPASADMAGWYVGSNQAHHQSVAWVERVRESGLQAERLSAIRTKTAALYAGLGVYRMNTLLYTPTHGSNHAIQVFAVSGLYEPDSPSPCGNPEKADLAPGCRECRRCADACPTGALDGEGGINVSKCLRRHMFSGKPTPVEYRRLMDRRLIGCEICQTVCPMQPTNVEIRPRERYPWMNVAALLEPTAETMASLGEAIGVNYAKIPRVQAQAALIAGNVCLREYLTTLERLISVDDEAVSEHARWAAERIRYGCPE